MCSALFAVKPRTLIQISMRTTAGHARFAVDAVIADERATRERWRGRRKPTGRPDIGSKEARQSKRAKVCPDPTAL